MSAIDVGCRPRSYGDAGVGRREQVIVDREPVEPFGGIEELRAEIVRRLQRHVAPLQFCLGLGRIVEDCARRGRTRR